MNRALLRPWPRKGIQLEMPALLRAEIVGSGGHKTNTKLRDRLKAAVEGALRAQ